MKKSFLLGIVSLLILTGCGKDKVICSGKAEIDGIYAESKVTATLKDDKVTKVSAEMTFETEEIAQKRCDIMEKMNSFSTDENNKIKISCEGKKVIIEDYTKMVSLTGEKETIGISRDDFIKALEQEKTYKCK